MSYQTHDLSEWAAVLSLGVSAVGVIKLALAFADADLAYFDPRPLARRTARAVHQAVVHAGHDLNRALAISQQLALQARDRARLAVVTALLALALRLTSIPSAPQKGALR